MSASDAPLRVAIDATSLIGARTGVGRFTEELVTRLARRTDIDLAAFAVTWRGRGKLRARVPEAASVVGPAVPARLVRAAWLRSDLPPVEWLTGRCDVVHGPNYVVPPARHAAEVVSVHDLTPIRFPELCTADTLQFPPLIARAVRRGAWVVTGSRFVADEIAEAFPIDPDRIVVVADGFTPPPPDEAGSDAATGRRIAGAGRYVLALGTVEPRKDLPTLVAAFDRLAEADRGLHLVIAGPDGWGAEAVTAARLRATHRRRIRRLGWVSDQQRAALLRGAAVFAYPSRYEGFGLPPLEAMAIGTPVVTTTAGSLPEVVGDAAVLVAPRDADALAAALSDVLTDGALRASLVARGTIRSGRYDWDSTAVGMVDLYRRAHDAR